MKLTDQVKLTEYGAASDAFAPTKEDERSAALALRARQGDYDDGIFPQYSSLLLLDH
jgi:hypothetical protein